MKLLQEALRSLRRQPAASSVAIVGLALALTAGLLLAFIALTLSAVDPNIREPERVVLLDFKGNAPQAQTPWITGGPVAIGTLLQQRKVPLEQITRVAFDGLDIQHQGRLQPAYLIMADPSAVPLLGLRALAGDLPAALVQRDGIAISQSLLQTLWPEATPAQALGRTLVAQNRRYTVAAVLPDTDPRTPFWPASPMVGDAMAMVGWETQGNRWTQEERDAIFMANGRVFARLQPGARAADVGGWMREAVKASPGYAKLPADWTAGGREPAYFRGLPLTELPYAGPNEEYWGLITALVAACTLLLVMAAFNHMNLQAAALLQRQRETALRRSLGADSPALLRLWALEGLLPLLLAAGLALLAAWMLAPLVGPALGFSPRQRLADPVPWQALAGLGAVVALLWPLCSLLPAWQALRRPPAPALQGRTASEGPWGRRTRQALLGLQLGGALLLLSLAGVLALQQQHLLQAERGFQTEGRYWLGLMVNPAELPPMEGLARAVAQHPAISHWAWSDSPPAQATRGRLELHTSAGSQQQVLRLSTVSSGFFGTYGMRVLAGEVKVPAVAPAAAAVAASAPAAGESRMVIDAKAARALGFASPQAAVGAVLRGGGGFMQAGNEPRRVVAVVADVKLESARSEARPQGFLLNEAPQWDLNVHGPDPVALRAALDEVWRQAGPPVPHQIRSATSQLAAVYAQEAQLAALLGLVALLAVAVALAGAYALVADTLRRRRTELVLRRLHGAGPAAMARAVLAECVWPAGIAALVALPLAAAGGALYLEGFEDRIDLAAGVAVPMLLALGATTLVTGLALARHLRQALKLQPIEALR
jgi:hypothetical protein